MPGACVAVIAIRLPVRHAGGLVLEVRGTQDIQENSALVVLESSLARTRLGSLLMASC